VLYAGFQRLTRSADLRLFVHSSSVVGAHRIEQITQGETSQPVGHSSPSDVRMIKIFALLY
jgi:hypothetical protein